MNYICGYRIQLLCDKFIASKCHLDFNPYISARHSKSYLLENLTEPYDNPKLIYCCSADLLKFKEKINLFKNPFILVSHNSDENIYNNDDFNYIANHPKIIKWYTQNLMMEHYKVSLLPIGIANPQWEHGNIELLSKASSICHNKTNNIYFYYNINTNYNKRNECYLKLKDFIPFAYLKPVKDYFNYLATFKFAICPEGNGIDTHRLWECFYLRVVPIVVNNLFNRKVKETYGLPIIILEDWNDLRNIYQELNYDDYEPFFINLSKLDINYLKQEILKENNYNLL
jgi:hypothetical protein